jgi:hypothetical protein
MTEEVTQASLPIHCERTQKLLARMNEHDILLWCKQCKTYHPLSWAVIEQSLEDMKHDHSAIIVMSA